jgi:hypothetical protein
MIKFNTKWMAGFLTVLFSVMLSFPGLSDAKVLFGKYYGEAARKSGKTVEGNHPDGFRPKIAIVHSPYGDPGPRGADSIDYPVVLDNQLKASSGTILIRVKRLEAARNIAQMPETLFNIGDPDGKSILNAGIVWPENVQDEFAGKWPNGAIELSSDIFGDGAWGRWIPFGKKLMVGPEYTIALTWDNGVKNVYLDGQLLANRYSSFWEGAPVSPDNVPFGNYLRSVKRIRLGADNEVTNSPLMGGYLTALEVYDQALNYGAGMPVIRNVTDDSFKVPGISGKLVAGETVTATLVALPGGSASFDMGRIKGIPMVEQAIDAGGSGRPPVLPGTYVGSYTIKPGDDFENGQIVGHFLSADSIAAEPVLSASRWTIETKPVVTFAIAKKDLPADLGTKSRIKLTAKDANGNPLKGRNLKLTLSTTDEYTGTVGAGDFGKQVGASVETRWKGATDAWGEVEFDYVAGFAAKTVILQAKDLDSGGVSVDYLTAYKEASIDIALTAPRSLAAARRGLQYSIKVEASRTQLTADGKSRSVIRATVSDPNGKPVPGDAITFALSSPNGTLRTIVGVTDGSGTATAEYIAGKKIGVVVISATDTVRNVSGSVSILLLADAPAKVILKARPETLPADGNSKADIQVKVTDINDNPNKDTKVEFKVVQANMGRLDYADRVTDNFGDALNRLTAGTTPGIATILATVRSKVPTEAELLKAKNVLFVPGNEADETVRIEKWLKKKGDTVLLGEPIVTYTVGREKEVRTIVAPYDLTMGETFVEYWDNAEIGQTLATVVPASK